MSEALIGVVIGGLLSSLGTWITLAVQHRRWIAEMRIARLQAKRDKLEATCESILRELASAMANNSYPSSMMSDIDFLCPEPVSKMFEALMADENKDDLAKKNHYYLIARAMKKALKDIDDQIDAVALSNGAA